MHSSMHMAHGARTFPPGDCPLLPGAGRCCCGSLSLSLSLGLSFSLGSLHTIGSCLLHGGESQITRRSRNGIIIDEDPCLLSALSPSDRSVPDRRPLEPGALESSRLCRPEGGGRRSSLGRDRSDILQFFKGSVDCVWGVMGYLKYFSSLPMMRLT